MVQLLEYINIGEDFVREIIVHYKDGKDEKIDKARLKESHSNDYYIYKGLI